MIPPTSASASPEDALLAPLLHRLDEQPGFPALSESVAAINEITHGEDQNIEDLAAVILKDVGLTASILRVANSATYRSAGGGGITTVSRAVGVLGFSTLRDIALSVVLFNQIRDHANARELKESFLRAQLAATLAREAGRQVLPRQAEEVYTGALFHGLGHLLVLMYFPAEAQRIRERVAAGGLTDGEAAREVLGVDFAGLGQAVATHWKFPLPLVRCQRPLPAGDIAAPASPEDALWILAGFGNEVANALAADIEQAKAGVGRLRRRFAAVLHHSAPQLHGLVQGAVEDTKVFAGTMGVRLTQSSFIRHVAEWVAAGPDEPEIDALTAAPKSAADRPAAAPKVDARQVLSEGISRLSGSLVGDFALPEVLRLAIQILREAMDFQRVLFCARDDKAGLMVARMGVGRDADLVARKFHFPIKDAPNAFQLAIGHGVDIVIKDTADPKIAANIPVWYRSIVSARSFVLMPLLIRQQAVGLIYCDKQEANGIHIPERELALMKTLRNQVLLAIKQGRPGG